MNINKQHHKLETIDESTSLLIEVMESRILRASNVNMKHDKGFQASIEYVIGTLERLQANSVNCAELIETFTKILQSVRNAG